MKELLSKRIMFSQKLIIILLGVLFFWWIMFQLVFKNDLSQVDLTWAASYQIIALIGAITGFFISKSWGGYKSLIGKVIIFFSLGLLAQVFGQSTFSFFNLILKVEIPYPSIADMGFFSSMIFYLLGVFYLSKVTSVHISLKTLKNKILAVFIPLGILIMSYTLFLKGYSFDWGQPLRVFLDFGYPLGDAIYISLALIALLFSSNFLSGIMKWPILFILFALITQYIADFNFLYQATNGTWVNGGYGDLLYMFAYFFTSTSLIQLGLVFNRIKETNN